MEEIPFRYNGRRLKGLQGDTIAIALLRNGIRVFDRSVKRRMKRGVSCLEGYCMSCLLEVNGQPDVITCRTPLRLGMDIRSQVAIPSPKVDIRAPIQVAAFKIAGPELYYRLFTKPAWASELWMRFLARMAGRGRLAAPHAQPDPLPFQTCRVDVLVVGGGLAGIASADEANHRGANVMIIDRNDRLGGAYTRWQALGDVPELLEPLTEPLPQLSPDVQVLNNATLLALYEDKTALALSEQSAYRIFYDVAVIATGSYPRVVSFPGSDAPLHLPVQGLLRAAVETSWVPRSAILLDVDSYGTLWKSTLESLGTTVHMEKVTVEDCLTGQVQARNGSGRKGIQLASGKRLYAEVVCWSAGWYPRTELIRMAGGKAVYQKDSDQFLPVLTEQFQVAPDTFAAGGCTGTTGFRSALEHGRQAGARAVAWLRIDANQERPGTPDEQLESPPTSQGGDS